MTGAAFASFMERLNRIAFCFIFAAALMTGCSKPDDDKSYKSTFYKSKIVYKDRIFSDRKVFILYSAGHNSLSGELLSDIRDLYRGTEFHTDNPKADAVVIYTHSGSSASSSESYLIYPHLDRHGDFVCDTLRTWPGTTVSASAKTLNEVLVMIKDKFPADEYGMLFSSHCTGFLPEGYYAGSKQIESSASAAAHKAGGGPARTGRRNIQDPEGVPYTEPERIPGLPLTKSIGQDREQNTVYEMRLEDFAEAIPMKMKYIIFDACLMGCAEAVWQLKDKTEYIIASPAEVLSDGMDYITMVSYVHHRPEADLEGFCRNYFEHYDRLSGAMRSATISLYDCSAADHFARTCAKIFDAHRERLGELYMTEKDDIQRYYTYDYHWFFDIEDIVVHLGCTDDELAEFREALGRVVVYKAATEMFLTSNASYPYPGFVIRNYSGMSMYLPIPDSQAAFLNSYYRTLGWNKAAGLIK